MQKPTDPARWRDWATRILESTGLPGEPSRVVAAGLVEGDLYGHSTHGLALLPDYVEEIESGAMTKAGVPEIVADAGAIALWNGRRLPGVWTTQLAVADAIQRSEQFGLGGVAIRESHHIACLAAFLEEPARNGYLILVISSDPSARHVAPYGGKVPVMTPNPIAAGIPRDPDPILIDVSMSTTAAGVVARHKALGRKLPGEWLLDSQGQATNDPAALSAGGSILSIGGVDNGYKGFGLSLLVEALTQSLAGFGRADEPGGWGAGVCVLAFAPQKLAGDGAFRRQSNWLAEACLAQESIDPTRPIRLPGQLAIERKRTAMREGLVLPDLVFDGLKALADRMGNPLPA